MTGTETGTISDAKSTVVYVYAETVYNLSFRVSASGTNANDGKYVFKDVTLDNSSQGFASVSISYPTELSIQTSGLDSNWVATTVPGSTTFIITNPATNGTAAKVISALENNISFKLTAGGNFCPR